MSKDLYSEDKVEEIRSKLKGLPPKKVELTKQEVVKSLKKEIEELKKKGYTLQDIADTLKGSGITISAPTLRSYLSTKSKKPSTNKKREITKQKIEEAAKSATIDNDTLQSSVDKSLDDLTLEYDEFHMHSEITMGEVDWEDSAQVESSMEQIRNSFIRILNTAPENLKEMLESKYRDDFGVYEKIVQENREE